jgi:hypothetical protein
VLLLQVAGNPPKHMPGIDEILTSLSLGQRRPVLRVLTVIGWHTGPPSRSA